MPLESPTYISDLVPANPAHTDGINQTDAHCRIIKQTLQATFPAITGTVTATHTQLNTIVGLAALVASGAATAVQNVGAQTAAGPLTVTTSVNSASIQKGGNELLPTGIIAMWSGLTSNVPAGWTLCDGTSGTPNLVGMFIVGAGTSPAPGTTGGNNIQSFTTSTVSNHTHTGATASAGGHSHTGTTDTQGGHSHTGSTAGYALTINDMPNHDHGQGGQQILHPSAGTGGGTGTFLSATAFNAQGGGAAHLHAISVDGSHSHNTTDTAVAGHTHPITSDGAHNHIVAIDVRPTYYAICLIMKL